MANITSASILKTVRKPSFWLIVALLILITYLHYENYEQPSLINNLFNNLGLTRHAFERILYLAPIVWAGFFFGWMAGVFTSLVALAAMLPRIIFISSFQADSFFEAGSVFIIGNVISLTFYTLKKEREYRLQLEEAEKQMHFYISAVNTAQEEERKRIAQELHDDTIQSLVVLSRGLDLLASSRAALTDEEYRHRLEALRQLSVDIMTGIRRLSQDLRPAALDKLGLVSALESLAADIAKYWKIQIKVNIKGEVKRLSPDKELALFRIVQEALRNVWRHSQATQAELNIEVNDPIIKITVRDNGKGFEIPKDMTNLPSAGKLGMAGMHERAQLIGAKLSIESKLGKGTKVTIEVNNK